MDFRDITGSDLEYLETVLGNEEETVLTGNDVTLLLKHLCVTPNVNFSRLVPRDIKNVYGLLSTHILCNYMTKETWLRQCYSIQNGSFQNLEAMESVPMSKFVAMCQIHKEAMDDMNKDNDQPTT